VKPRVGFLGVGWIGRDRLLAIARSGAAEIAAIADASKEAATSVAAEVGAPAVTIDALLDHDLGFRLDGVVIATPSALHAEQSIRALANGLSVFCQKPLGRTAAECASVVDAARRVDRLLGVDLSYRHVEGAQRMREIVQSGGIGDVYASELVFHNAYGPDKPWFRDPELAGGGCVIDLGIHLVDLALWMLDGPKVDHVTSRLFAGGRPLDPRAAQTVVEDHAVARVDLANGGAVTLACSWFLPAGRDAVIEATFYGTGGAVSLRNVDGSFYDFVAERFDGTSRTTLAEPPDAWGGRAAIAWANRVAESAQFDPAAEELVEVAAVLDGIYGR
jgi:predicted dehydrogenase